MDATNYPSISTLLDPEAVTGNLGVVGETVGDLLDRIRYKNLIIETSPENDAKFYSLTLVTKELSLDLLGSGLMLIFFPAEDQTVAASDIDVTFDFRWQILKYVPEFETLSFAQTARAFFDILLELIDITEEEFLSSIVGALIDDSAPYQALVDKLKAWRGGTSQLAGLTLANQPVGYNEIEYIVRQVPAGVDIFVAAFEAVVEDVSDIEKGIDNVVTLFGTWLGDITRGDIEDLLLPQFVLELTRVRMALQVPRSVLVPLDAIDDVTKCSRLTFTAGGVRYDSSTGFDIEVDQSITAKFTKSIIPGFGMTIEFDDIKIDLSDDADIPEVAADDRPPGFKGVYIGNAVLGLPEKWFDKNQSGSGAATLAIIGRKLLIGTGGFSGTIGLEALSLEPAHLGKPDPNGPQSPPPNAKINFILGKKPPPNETRKGFEVGFSSFDMKFRHGALLESKIKGSLTIPKFDPNPIDIELFIGQDGDFEVTASVPGNGHPFRAGTAFTFEAQSLKVRKDDKRVFLEATGNLTFPENDLLSGIITKPIHIEKLRIHSDGSFEIEGGTIPLPESVGMPLGPATIAITAIHCGKHEQDHDGTMRQYAFWGFDAGISVDPGVLHASGDGIKYYYTVDDNPDPNLEPKHHHFLHIEGLGIDLRIPGDVPKDKAALLIKGYLSLKEDFYKGSLSIQLPQLKIAGSASMEYYKRIPAWFVEAKLSLSVPVPLAASGLGIYDFHGLFGLRYVAAKEAVDLDDEASWGDYYRAPPGKGVSLDKFLKPERTEGASNPFSIGAGVGLATTPNDRAFSAQLFLLVSIPNLILLEGRGDVAAEKRVGPSDDPDPPYYAYLALSPDSIEIGAGAHYMVPKSTGEVLDLNATLEAAFFFNNASAWYVHFGTKAKPMTARVLSLFDAYAYLMLSASGIEAGTGVHYDFDKKYGPVSVSAHAYLDLWAYLSFERGQAGGCIVLGGYVDIKFLGVGFHIEIATGLTVDAPKPFRVAGYVHVCVSVNLRIKKFEKCVDVAFVWERDLFPDTTAIPVLPASGAALPFAAGVHMASGRSYEVQVTDTELAPEAISKEVPLDTYIDLKFLKPVDPSNVTIVGGRTNAPSGNVELIPPKHGWQTVTHSYKLKEIRLETWSSKKNGWITYHPFLALAQGALLSAADAAKLSGFPIGAWQKQGTDYSQIRILALTPFSYMEPVGGYRPEQMGITAATLFCEGVKRTETCVKFDMVGPDGMPAPWMDLIAGVDYYRKGLLFRIEGENTASVPIGTSPPQVMLAIKPGSRAIFQFPQAIVRCRLAFISGAPSVTLRFQQRKPHDPSAPVGLPEFVDVKTLVATPNALTNPITYDDPATPIDRVIVEPPAPDNQAIAALQERIAALREASPALRDLEALQQQLDAEHGKYCGGSLGGAGPPGGGECATYLYQVCWLAEEDWKFNQTIPGTAAVEANFQNMRDAVEETIAPVFRPNQRYRVVLTVSDTVNGSTNTSTRYVQFRTGGALGFFDANPGSPPPPGLDDGRAEIPERFLKFYIDMERSDPAPGGNLLYAKPLYYGAPVLRLFFAKPYAYHFFADWPEYHAPPNSSAAAELDPDHYELIMRIKDPAESGPAPDAPDYATPLLTEALTGEQSWNTDPAPRRTEDLKVLSNMRNPLLGGVDPGPTCWTVGGDPITPAAKALQVELHDLEPNKLYTAVVINRHTEAAGGFTEAEVHRYPFRTSIYPDFQSHIGSYRLKDEEGNNRPAVFVVSHDLAAAAAAPQTYAAARNILQQIGAADRDSEAYPDFFDRLIYACLKLEPLPPARSLEFNFMRNALTQGIYGMWIRSLEALNNPRLSQVQFRSAIRMYVAGSELLSPSVLFSKDCCQAFVMTAADAFPTQGIAFAFDHLIWNGKAFAIGATAQTDPFSAP